MGFKTEQFLKDVDENLVCSICHEVFQDPVSCKDGHTFCSGCIGQWLKTHNTCPLDNSKITDKKLVRNLTVSNIIDNLEVCCHPQDKKIEMKAAKNADAEETELKCDWTGKLQCLSRHRETCSFKQVQCPHVNCNKLMQRRKLEYHDEVCLFKRVMCGDCRLVLIRHELEKHRRDNCPEAIILCPNRCTSGKGLVNTRMKRKDLNHHLANICAKAIVDCPYKDQGCTVQDERQDVEKHVQENMAAHMMLLAQQCSFLIKQNSSLNEQNSSLAGQCSSLTKKCSALTEQCSSLTNENQLLKDELKEVKEKEELSRSYIWRFDYRSVSKEDVICYRSPTFWLCGYSWYLVMFPNGNVDAKGFVSVYLNLNEECSSDTSVRTLYNRDISVSCRLSVMKDSSFDNDASQKNFVFKASGSFGLRSLWDWKGWPRFLRADDAISTYCDARGYLSIRCIIQLKEMPREENAHRIAPFTLD